MENFGDWLLAQLETRGWSQSELARRAGLGNATLSRIISGLRRAGPDAALSIAETLGEPPEKVFRLAGLLPPWPGGQETDAELQQIADRLVAIWLELHQLDPESAARLTRIALMQSEMVLAAAQSRPETAATSSR